MSSQPRRVVEGRSRGKLLSKRFYDRDTAHVAKSLVGKILVRRRAGRDVRVRIVETEAYLGLDDPACHLWGGFSPRTEGTWGRPGVAYVFTIYGIYQCLNAITLSEAPFGGVLIRAAEPLGINAEPRTTSGPGRLARFLGVDSKLNGHDYGLPPLQIYDDGARPRITVGPRVGISKAKDEPLRFAAVGNAWVSSPRVVRVA